MLGSGNTEVVEILVRLQAEAAAGDLLLDLGGAAEDRLDAAAGSDMTGRHHITGRPLLRPSRAPYARTSQPVTGGKSASLVPAIPRHASDSIRPPPTRAVAAASANAACTCGGEHLARQRPIAGQHFFRTPVMIWAGSHSELPHGLGGSMSGIRGTGFRGRVTAPDRAATGPLPYFTTRSTDLPLAQFSAASREIPRQLSPCLVGGSAMRPGTSELRH
jgi:hypothetical protein